MGRRLVVAVVLLVVGWTGLSGCASQQTGRASASCEGVRAAAVNLMLANLNATALPRAYDRHVLRARMRHYMARSSLESRFATVSAAIAKLGGKAYVQPWTASITVGEWEACEVDGRDAAVVFVGYERTSRQGADEGSPLTRYTVSMRRERGDWKLTAYQLGWLTSAGPSGDSGALMIGSLPERVVFRAQRKPS